MNASVIWSRILIAVGVAGMLVGAIDPLEGCFVILPSVCVVALGAHIGKSRHRRLLFWSAALVAVGVGAMVVLSALGGIGGSSGQSMWWGLLILPYPVGWVMGMVGAVLAIIESWSCLVSLRHAAR